MNVSILLLTRVAMFHAIFEQIYKYAYSNEPQSIGSYFEMGYSIVKAPLLETEVSGMLICYSIPPRRFDVLSHFDSAYASFVVRLGRMFVTLS